MVLRTLIALSALGAIAVIPLGSAEASASTSKPIAYVSAGNLWTIGANGTGTTNLGETANNPSFSSDGETIIAYDSQNSRIAVIDLP